MNQLFAFVLVGCIELLLRPKPKLVRVKILESALHIVEYGILDV